MAAPLSPRPALTRPVRNPQGPLTPRPEPRGKGPREAAGLPAGRPPPGRSPGRSSALIQGTTASTTRTRPSLTGRSGTAGNLRAATLPAPRPTAVTPKRDSTSMSRHTCAPISAGMARVVMTRADNHGLGPCVDRRAEIINQSHANVAIDIHADGGPPSGRGFTVLEPIADGPNDKVINSSVRFGSYVRSAFLVGTPIPTSDYYGQNGIIFRDDLAGLNLTTVPKVLIECGNMRNATDT